MAGNTEGSAGLVLRGGSDSKGTVGADGRPGRGESLRGGTAGERRGEGPADRGGGIEAVELDGVGVARAPQRRSEEGEDRSVIEGENDHDLEVDRRGVVHGGPGLGKEAELFFAPKSAACAAAVAHGFP